MITNVDQNVGKLFAKLDQLGITDNTLVMFLVDNGPNTRRYVGDRRGMKSEVHDGGIRSPLWLHWPARFAAGRQCDQLAAHIDVTPTILDACGVPSPPDVRFDGISLLPLLEGRDVAWPERTIVDPVPPRRRAGALPPLHDPRSALETAPRQRLRARDNSRASPSSNCTTWRTIRLESKNLAAEKPDVVARLTASLRHMVR